MNSEWILLITGDSAARRDLRDILITEGFVVVEARTREEAVDEIQSGRISLALLHSNVPGMDPFQACERIRSLSQLPIVLLLGSRCNDKDHEQALGCGATDYLVRPFGSDQLIARIRTALRAAPTETLPELFKSPRLQIDFACRRVVVNNRSIHLTPKEFELLRHLVLNQGRPVSHVTLLEALWGSRDAHHIGHLRVFVNHRRKKIEPHSRRSRHSHIQTDNFIGYHFEANPQHPRVPGRSNG